MRGSLRLRLALWCGGIICGAVMVVALYGYAVHSRAHYDELDALLRNATEHVAGELDRSVGLDDRAHVLAAARGLGVGVALYDSLGNPLGPAAPTGSASAGDAPAVNPVRVIASPPRAPYGPLTALAPTARRAVSSRGVFGLAENGSQRWRVYVLPRPASMRADERVAPYVVGTAPLAELDASLRRVGLLLMLIAIVGNVLTFGTSWLLAGRALQPVLTLTEAASTIARSGAFSQRVPSDTPRDEIGRLAETFNEMLERLERAHATQVRFVSDASHELRAPLTVIQANLELLEHRPAMSPTERDAAVREAHAEAARLGRLVSDLLVLARADAGVPMRRDLVDLDRVVMDVLGEARHLMPRQRLEIVTLDPVVIAGDADRLKQLIINLVENAIKYTPDDGRVSIALRHTGGVADIEVRDTGIGIPAEDLPRVFERFYRADRARSRNAGGTGLGLAIAQWIARQHGGDIILSSEPGRGTVATVRLPVSA